MAVSIGTAGWAIPAAVADRFPREGSGLERYAAVFDAVEINSTFHRPHKPATFERWATSTPESFRFSVKVPRAVSHDARLSDCDEPIGTFLGSLAPLRPKLALLLLQLPPSLAFEAQSAGRACDRLARLGVPLCCEPRHVSWFTPKADAWLVERRIARVAADPARHEGAGEPGGWRGLSYWRLHGSPRPYYSTYGDAVTAALAHRIEQEAAAEVWCMFDNTASGAAAADALTLKAQLAGSNGSPPLTPGASRA